MKFIGILIILNSLAISGWVLTWSDQSKSIITICFLGVFSGVALTFHDRISELSINGIGSMKTSKRSQSSELSTQQKKKYIKEFKGFSEFSIMIQAQAGNPDGEKLGEQLKTIFEASGWKTTYDLMQAGAGYANITIKLPESNPELIPIMEELASDLNYTKGIIHRIKSYSQSVNITIGHGYTNK